MLITNGTFLISPALALDVMGGDVGPSVVIPAAIQALHSNPHLILLLVGKPDIITSLLAKINFKDYSRLQIIPAQSIITSNASPSWAIRNSYGSSMRIAIELVKNGYAQACVSAGNTGALMGLAKMLIKPINGIKRPALVTILPHQRQGKIVILDLGANINCNTNMLVQFALMGSVLAKELTDTNNPRVALLNIGKEEIKGLTTIRKAAALLKTMPLINYIGYLEANELLTGKTDVLVCDGFAGNIMLKTMEGIVRIIQSSGKLQNNKEKQEFQYSNILKCWLENSLWTLDYLNPDQYNGACLVGLRSIVIKSHGAANQQAFYTAIERAIEAVQRQIPQLIATSLESMLIKND